LGKIEFAKAVDVVPRLVIDGLELSVKPGITILDAALANLEQVKTYLTSQREADRIAAESSYIGLVDEYVRLGANLRR